MGIDAKCQNCGHEFRRPDGLAGKRVRCPKCSHVFCLPSVKVSEAECGDGDKDCSQVVKPSNLASTPPSTGEIGMFVVLEGRRRDPVPRGMVGAYFCIVWGFFVSLIGYWFLFAVQLDMGPFKALLLSPTLLPYSILMCMWARRYEDRKKPPILYLFFSGVVPGFFFYFWWQRFEDERIALAEQRRRQRYAAPTGTEASRLWGMNPIHWMLVAGGAAAPLVVLVVLVVLLVLTYAFPRSLRPVFRPPDRDITEMPRQFGSWQEAEVEVDPEQEGLLIYDADVIVDRVYADKKNNVVSLHMAVFTKFDAGIHRRRPLNGYAARGWTLLSDDSVMLPVSGKSIKVSLTTLERDGRTVMVVYWYQFGEHILLNGLDLRKARSEMWGRETWPTMVGVLLQTSASDQVLAKKRIKEVAGMAYEWLDHPGDEPNSGGPAG